MSAVVEYVRLMDNAHKDIVVRCEGRHWQQFVAGVGWKETGILIRYFSDESDLYEMYEEISAEQARELVEKQGGNLLDKTIEE